MNDEDPQKFVIASVEPSLLAVPLRIEADPIAEYIYNLVASGFASILQHRLTLTRKALF